MALLVAAVAAVTYLASHAVFVTLNDLLRGDIKLHNSVLTDKTGQPPAGYTIYYTILSWVAHGSSEPGPVRAASETLLAAAMAAKAVVTLLVLRRATGTVWPSLAGTAFLMLCAPLDFTLTPEMYFGRFTGSVWHNSTSVVLLPVSVLLFYAAVRFIPTGRPRWAYVAVPALLVLDGLLKPNYLLALLPALGVLTLVVMVRAYRRTRLPASIWPPLVRFLLLAVPAVVLLYVEYVLAYVEGGVEYTNGIRPFATWSLFASYVPGGILVTLVQSLLLPALVTALLWDVARRSTLVTVAWLVELVAIAQFALLAEFTSTGELLTHGNWVWGANIATYVLLLAVTILWIRHGSRLRWWAQALVYTVAAGYLVSGIVYLQHLVTPGGAGYH